MRSMGQLLLWMAFAAVCRFSSALSPDGVALLEVRSALNDTEGRLRGWDGADATPCRWTGVACHPSDHTVSSINLPYMQLGGVISPSIGKLRRLQRLALHQNRLRGVVPSEIGNCPELKAVYLRANFIQGGIPTELGNLSRLVILDLSSNSLKGAIPASLGRLGQLRFLNLSSNLFFGEIPNMGVLGTFGGNSFSGNPDLCGLQIRKPCRTSMGFPVILPHTVPNGAAGSSEVQPRRSSSHVLKYLLIGALSTIGLFSIFSCFMICLVSRKRKIVGRKYTQINKQLQQDIGAKLVTFHGNLPYDSIEIIRKLEQLEEDDVVGSGGYGVVYKMVMSDSCAYAVKSIDTAREGSNQIFERQLEILGIIKHKNLVSLRAYCCLPSSKVLIYDYFALGSLDNVLHGHGPNQLFLYWTSRLKIAIGTARGIAYLHHDCCPRIVHQDIKSNNILLNRNLEPLVSDFGLANLLVDDEAYVTTVVAGTFGYLAPEYLNSGRGSEKSDVYSYGVLLLELISGKRPTDPSFVKRGLNIVGWMNTLLMENQLLEIVDKTCKDADAETVELILEIAAKCTEADPESRPTMNRVLQILEEEVSPCLTEFYENHSDL